MYQAKIVLGSVTNKCKENLNENEKHEIVETIRNVVRKQSPEISYLDISFQKMKRPYTVLMTTVPSTTLEESLFDFLKDEIECCIDYAFDTIDLEELNSNIQIAGESHD